MTLHVPDRFKAANAFWMGLAKIGLTPAAVLSQARQPCAAKVNIECCKLTLSSFIALKSSLRCPIRNASLKVA